MKSQLISIDPEGNISGLRMKKDQGLDLRLIRGTFAVRRVTEILWENDRQGYVIHLLPKKGEPRVLNFNLLNSVGVRIPAEITYNTADGIPAFHDYDEAVEIEIQYLTKAKEHGMSLVW